MQSNAGPAREDKDARQSSTSIPRYGPIYTPSGGQAQAAQQQQSQQQQTPRRDGLAPIAPAPGAFSLSGTSGASSASAMTPSGIALTREIPARPKRKLINLACTACQKRKSKVRLYSMAEIWRTDGKSVPHWWGLTESSAMAKIPAFSARARVPNVSSSRMTNNPASISCNSKETPFRTR